MKHTSYLRHALVLLLAACLSACPSKVQMSEIADDSQNSAAGSTGSTGGSTTNPPIGTVNNYCNSPNKQIREVEFFFPKPNQTCEWNANGNLAARNQYFQGRIEQEQILDLGGNTVICDVDFEFAEQPFLYDDHVLMTFNDAIIASSYNFDDRFNFVNGLLRYDWTKMAGMYWDNKKEGTFCPAGSSCDWPVTDTNGQIKIEYPATIFKTIMAEDLNRSQHSVKFISIGDNDGMDCEHSDLRFTMQVTYVNK